MRRAQILIAAAVALGPQMALAEQPLAHLGGATPITECLSGPRDLDVELGGLNLQSDYGSYSIEHNLYFVNTCTEPLVSWICAPTAGEVIHCSNEPYVPSGGRTSSFSPIAGDDYFYIACPVGENACNARAFEWYQASDGAPRGTNLDF